MLLAALGVAGVLAGCGAEEEEGQRVSERDADSYTFQISGEGEPIELGGVEYNVAITRFLNPDDPEDYEYLVGQEAAEPGMNYLGVFLTVENDGEDPARSSDDYKIVDTLESEYEPVDSESPYALQAGATVPGEGQLPAPDTTAATGPIHAAMLLFYVPDNVTENRPLELEVGNPDAGDVGRVELDI
jgi:hypothetical protein